MVQRARTVSSPLRRDGRRKKHPMFLARVQVRKRCPRLTGRFAMQQVGPDFMVLLYPSFL